jgi:glycyl-tRNA synthetase (class II)
MVTIRDRDTMLQERISIEKLKEVVNAKVDWRRR